MLIIDMCGRLLLGSSVFWSGTVAAIRREYHDPTASQMPYCLRSLFASFPSRCLAHLFHKQ